MHTPHLPHPAPLTSAAHNAPEMVWPSALTTVRQPLLEKGLTAGRLLVDPPHDHGPQRIMLPVQLVPRGSTRRA